MVHEQTFDCQYRMLRSIKAICYLFVLETSILFMVYKGQDLVVFKTEILSNSSWETFDLSFATSKESYGSVRTH